VLQMVTRRPLILDFRDPWTTNPYRAHFQPWRRAVEGRLETFAVRRAAMVVANTQALRDEFRERFPDRADRFVAVYNSVDATITEGPERPVGQRPVTIVHAGFLYGPRDPLTLLRAISRRRKRMNPGAAPDLVLHLIGPAELPYDVTQKIDELEITDFVKIHGPLPHAACMDIMASSDALLLFQPGTRTQLPSKVFEYVTFAKPILTLAEPGGETYRFAAEELDSTVAACGDEEAIVAALDSLVGQLARGERPDVSRWSLRLAAFSEAAVTSQLLEAIDAAVVHVPQAAAPRST
jgi:glycosyltransferase involved in cell wall biosynthesis